VGDARPVERGAELVVRERMGAALQGLDHRHPRARDAAAACGDELAGSVGGGRVFVQGHIEACCGGARGNGSCGRAVAFDATL